MKICPVTKENFEEAAAIYETSWKASHKAVCSPAFLESRDCRGFLRREWEAGKAVYLLTDKEPCGIVSVAGDCIENLYVLPRLQNRGYGTRLLRFAASLCARPRLTVLSSNSRAIALYRRLGFRESGESKKLRDDLLELELILEKNDD